LHFNPFQQLQKDPYKKFGQKSQKNYEKALFATQFGIFAAYEPLYNRYLYYYDNTQVFV